MQDTGTKADPRLAPPSKPRVPFYPKSFHGCLNRSDRSGPVSICDTDRNALSGPVRCPARSPAPSGSGLSGPVPILPRPIRCPVRSGATFPNRYSALSGPVWCPAWYWFSRIRCPVRPVDDSAYHRIRPDPVQCTIRCSVDLAIFRSQARCPSCHTGCRRGGSLPSMVRLTLRACRRVELQSAPRPPQRRSARCPGAMSFDTYLLETAWHRRLRRIRKLCPAAWATWIALNQQDHHFVENHLVARLHERYSFMRSRLWKRNRSWRLTTANMDASCRKLRRHLRRAWRLRMCNRMSATTSS